MKLEVSLRDALKERGINVEILNGISDETLGDILDGFRTMGRLSRKISIEKEGV